MSDLADMQIQKSGLESQITFWPRQSLRSLSAVIVIIIIIIIVILFSFQAVVRCDVKSLAGVLV